jgi:1,4-dihydroxy-2-naphthoate octaprenyltransferase
MVAATVAVFALAGGISLSLVQRGGMPVVWLAAASILSGIFYTAGRYSLAYTGLADLFVIVFFGPVAVAGTYYLQIPFGWPPPEVFVVGLGPGLIATSLLAVNNLRDVEEDRENAKKTLAVRFGRRFSRMEYRVCMVLALLLPPLAAAATGRSLLVFALWILIPEARKLFKRVETGITGKDLNPVLGGTGRFLFQYALLFFVTWPHCALCWM